MTGYAFTNFATWFRLRGIHEMGYSVACPSILVDVVATGSYNLVVKRLKTVGVKELKNNLSLYLREVRGGATVLVSDRNNVVAELQKPYGRSASGGVINSVLSDWAEAGLVSLPTTEKAPIGVSPVKARAGTSAELLENDREEKRE